MSDPLCLPLSARITPRRPARDRCAILDSAPRTALLLLAALFAESGGAAAQELLVAGFNSGVHRYDFATGAFLGMVGNVNDPLGITHGPDGHVYVAEEATDKVLRFDGTTLAFLDEFVHDDPATPFDENGPLNGPAAVLFGEDGNLYVSSFANDRILRYDGQTGGYLGTFVSAGAGGLNGPDAGMAWGPDGHLYVPSFFNHRVLKFDRVTGAPLGSFVAPGSGGLTNPRTLVFRSDGTLLVTSEGSDQILHYDASGGFLGPFVTPNFPNATGLVISPLDGNLYASNLNANNTRRFNGTDGTWEGVLVPGGTGGLSGPVFLALHPDPYLRTSRFEPGTTGALNEIRVTGAAPGELEIWLVGFTPGSLPFAPCPHLFFGVADPFFVFTFADPTGTTSLQALIGNELLGLTVLLQAFEFGSCRVSNLVIQTFQ